MGRRTALGLLLALCLTVVSTAVGADVGDRKRAVDSRIGELQASIDRARERERLLTTEIAAVTSKIRVVQGDVDSAQSQLSKLEAVLALHQRRLERLTELYELQTRRLRFLKRQHRIAVGRLSRRVVELYTQDTPDAMSYVLAASSFTELVEQLEFLNDLGRQDDRITTQVREAKVAMRATRERTKQTRTRVAATTRAIADRTAEQRTVRDRLVASRDELASARSLKRDALTATQDDREAYLHEVEALQQQSASLAARIRAAQSAAPAPTLSSPNTGAPSASGFVWPANGVLTSGYGWRWGRMHEGIDIAVPTGTAVVASAAGTVIVAGWVGGYGNLVVVDHGGGLATAYGHNSGFASGVGQTVVQGQVIAYAGSTGNSTGPHIHFEVRINGSPVDPLGYL
jgi:murein DD-endopeptidase MepM/ murein hydrolase activator NlpD